MYKKISILTLTLLFLVSTTGMPVFSHYCGMSGKRSLTECEDCLVEMQLPETSCCTEEIPDYSLVFTSDNMICCIDEFDYQKVEEVFSPSLNLNTINFATVVSEYVSITVDSEKQLAYSNHNNQNLPPPKFGKELLTIIHQLKIDTPIS